MATQDAAIAAAQAFDWSSFASNVVATGVGAVAAFGFAIWLARIENQRERQERSLEMRETNLLTVKATVDACAQNLEELVNFKSQMMLPLLKDTTQMEALLLAGNPAAVVAGAETMQSFFKEVQTASFATVPHSDRFAFILDEVSSITGFVHRAATSLEKVNSSIELRNELLRRWADVARGGPSTPDLAYFLPMLSSYARAMASNADDALFFNHLLHDQSYYIGLERFSRPSFRHVVLPANMAALVPATNYIKGYRERLVKFGFATVSLVDDAQPQKPNEAAPAE